MFGPITRFFPQPFPRGSDTLPYTKTRVQQTLHTNQPDSWNCAIGAQGLEPSCLHNGLSNLQVRERITPYLQFKSSSSCSSETNAPVDRSPTAAHDLEPAETEDPDPENRTYNNLDPGFWSGSSNWSRVVEFNSSWTSCNLRTVGPALI